MAHAIRQVAEVHPSETQIRRLEAEKIQATLVRHADDLSQSLDILGLLREKGLLDLLRALLEQGDDIVQILVDQAGRPTYANGLKNLMGLAQLIGVVDVSSLHSASRALASAHQRAQKEELPEFHGLYSLLALLNDPDVQYAMAFLGDFLRSFGRELRRV